LAKTKRHAIKLTDALDPADGIIESMIAPDDGKLYPSIINRIYTAPKPFERIGNWKEIYQNHK